MAKRHEIATIRSSAAEYLTFVAASGNGGVEAVYADENVWLSQKMMAQLYDVDVRTINYHLKKVFADSELEAASVIRKFRITAADGKGDPNFDSDLGRIDYAFRQWRGEPAPDWWNEAERGKREYRDTLGFCKTEAIAGIGKHGFVLTPGRYVGAEEQEDDGEPIAEKYPRLLAELEACFGEGERLMAVVREKPRGVQTDD